MRPALLLTGGPAAGKSTTAHALAAASRLAAVVDVDDVRHLVVGGHAAPWDGSDGRAQQVLGVENSCDLAHRFLTAGVEVVLADVVNAATLPIYRRRLEQLLVVRLHVELGEAQRRAGMRPVHLTPDEFFALHQQEASCGCSVDRTIDVTTMSLQQQTAAVLEAWSDE